MAVPIQRGAILGKSIPGGNGSGGGGGGGNFAITNMHADPAHGGGCFAVAKDGVLQPIDSTGSTDAVAYYAAGDGGSLARSLHRPALTTPPRIAGNLHSKHPHGLLAGPIHLCGLDHAEQGRSNPAWKAKAGDCVDNSSPFQNFTGSTWVQYPAPDRRSPTDASTPTSRGRRRIKRPTVTSACPRRTRILSCWTTGAMRRCISIRRYHCLSLRAQGRDRYDDDLGFQNLIRPP